MRLINQGFPKIILFVVSSVVLSACGLGAVSTSAQNNSSPAAANATTLSTPTGTANDSNIATTTQGSTAGTGSPAAPNSASTSGNLDASSPNETAAPVVTPAAPSNANQAMQDANQAAVPKNFYDASSLTTSAFSWNEQSGSFTLILSTDRTVCALRSVESVKTKSRELQITATVSQKGNTLAIQDLTATMVLFGGTCAPELEASMANGASKINLSGLSATSVTGDYSFSLGTGGDGVHVVAGTFSASSCSGLSNGVPPSRVCLR